MLIEIEGLSHTYAAGTPLASPALRSVNLRIAAGERVAVMGPTGSGKSTLARVVSGLLRPTAGTVLLDGVPAHARGGDLVARTLVVAHWHSLIVTRLHRV